MGFLRQEQQAKSDASDDAWRTEDACRVVARLVRAGVPYIDADYSDRVHPLYREGNVGRYRVNFVRDDGRIKHSRWAAVELGEEPKLVKLGAPPRRARAN